MNNILKRAAFAGFSLGLAFSAAQAQDTAPAATQPEALPAACRVQETIGQQIRCGQALLQPSQAFALPAYGNLSSADRDTMSSLVSANASCTKARKFIYTMMENEDNNAAKPATAEMAQTMKSILTENAACTDALVVDTLPKDFADKMRMAASIMRDAAKKMPVPKAP